MPDFKFNLGSRVQDKITGFSGIITHRAQWLNNCNTYGVKPTVLKDGMPQDAVSFDEPQLILLEGEVYSPSQTTGGPERRLKPTTGL